INNNDNPILQRILKDGCQAS
ncbi:excisionase, partial [Proteus mirabilis]